MKAPLDLLKANGRDWAKLLDDGGDLTDKETRFKEAFSLLKSLAWEHMDLLVQAMFGSLWRRWTSGASTGQAA